MAGRCCGLAASDAAERGAYRHAHACGIALAQHVASHHLAGDEQVVAGFATEAHGGAGVDLQPQVGEGHARAQRVTVVGRGVERQCPVSLGRHQAFGVTVVEHGVVEFADAAGGVVVGHGALQPVRIQSELGGQLGQAGGADAVEDRWHEAANRLRVDDRVADLAGLLGHQPTPDRVALGPEVFALIVEALAFAVDHHAQRDRVEPGADAAIVERCACVDRHHVGLGRVTDRIGPKRYQVLEQHAGVVPGATDQEVVGRPFTQRVLAPGLTQPLAVGLEATGCEHAAARGDAFAAAKSCDKTLARQLDAVNRAVVAHLHAQALGTAVIGVDQRLAAA